MKNKLTVLTPSTKNVVRSMPFDQWNLALKELRVGDIVPTTERGLGLIYLLELRKSFLSGHLGFTRSTTQIPLPPNPPYSCKRRKGVWTNVY